LNLVCTFTFYIFKLHLNVVLFNIPSTSWPPKYSFPISVILLDLFTLTVLGGQYKL